MSEAYRHRIFLEIDRMRDKILTRNDITTNKNRRSGRTAVCLRDTI
ncbi:hypothetical protein CEV32_2220 [Brucella rhizosphaerae]|uniref:Uncharacterized protein n=1 Tax=Brucella rhizosphaerae TaxID=571254 RepID=A0A256F4J6_9HYPH|nr:hypothetical protein CEV32_2220 [Brucella rhizosphaerae]